MMLRPGWVLVAVALTTFTGVGNADNESNPLLKAHCIRCQFGVGNQASWTTGTPKLSQANFGTEGTLTFDSIDLRAGKARLIAGGVANVMVLPTPAGLTFLEETGSGNLILTTVFANYDSRGSLDFIGVMSRHMNMWKGGPLPSQFYGKCTILE